MTTQIQDTIYFEGEALRVSTDLLTMHPVAKQFAWESTANWKGYEAVWCVAAEKIFLISLIARSKTGRKLTMEDAFPGSDGPVEANWLSGEFKFEGGESVAGGNSVPSWSKYLITFEVKKGRVLSSSCQENPPYSPPRHGDPIMFQSVKEKEWMPLSESARLADHKIFEVGALMMCSEEDLRNFGLAEETIQNLKITFDEIGLFLNAKLEMYEQILTE